LENRLKIAGASRGRLFVRSNSFEQKLSLEKGHNMLKLLEDFGGSAGAPMSPRIDVWYSTATSCREGQW
jgi:hypothetical protein